VKGFAATCVIGACAAFAGQDPPQPAPLFRTDLEIVAVDFVAVSGDGSPVEGLGIPDLTLKVDGRTRPIKSVQFIRIGAPRTSALSSPPPARDAGLPDGRLPRGRTILIVIDEESIRQGDERLVVNSAQRFLDGLSGHDRVAVIAIPRTRVIAKLTTSHDEVRQALSRLSGHASTTADECERGYEGRTVLRALKAMLGGFAEDEKPATVVLISGGLLPTSSSRDPLRRSRCAPNRPSEGDYREVGNAAGSFRGQFYVIQPNSFAGASERGPAGADDDVRGLEDLVGVVGGQLFRPSGNADAVFDRISKESSAYYILGFEPQPSERDGKNHRIEVTTTRAGTTVRSRSMFAIPKRKAR
jgi:VWFA-related protein